MSWLGYHSARVWPGSLPLISEEVSRRIQLDQTDLPKNADVHKAHVSLALLCRVGIESSYGLIELH